MECANLSVTPSSWYYESLTPDLFQVSRLTKTVYSRKTKYQQVEIIDTVPFGRCLILDGKIQSAEADEFIYHESLVHPSLLYHPNPERVLIAGGGEGATLRETLKHNTIKSVTMVDLDEEVVAICKEYLPKHHAGAFDDSRVQLHHADIMRFLESDVNYYDVIIMDVPDPLEHGPAYLLYTQEFYTLLKSRLTPQGIAVIQAGFAGPTAFAEVFSPIHHTLSVVFPTIAAFRVFLPSFGGEWGFMLALNDVQCRPNHDEIDKAITQRIAGDLQFYDRETHAGIFSLPKYLRRGLANEQRIISINSPIFTT